MTVTELKALCKNVYAGTAQLEAGAQIPAGEGVQLARVLLQTILEKEVVEVPRV